MRLSSRAEYGTRALIELGFSYSAQRPLMLQRVAEKQHISKKYLEQIFALLREAGLVMAVRGPAGGYVLARSPESISLDEVMIALEGSLDVANPSALESHPSTTQTIWHKVNQAIQQALLSVSIADLMQRHQVLAVMDPSTSEVEERSLRLITHA